MKKELLFSGLELALGVILSVPLFFFTKDKYFFTACLILAIMIIFPIINFLYNYNYLYKKNKKLKCIYINKYYMILTFILYTLCIIAFAHVLIAKVNGINSQLVAVFYTLAQTFRLNCSILYDDKTLHFKKNSIDLSKILKVERIDNVINITNFNNTKKVLKFKDDIEASKIERIIRRK